MAFHDGIGADTSRRLLAAVCALALAVALLPIGAGSVRAQEAAAEQSLVFAVDGSGSISSVDFRTQKDGIIALLQDRSVVPVDGTLRVGLVQWAGSARVEIPLTTVDSPATVQSLVDQVDALVQLGGSTASGTGLVAAANLLADDPATVRTVCMSTDGVRNAGIAWPSAVDQAQAAGVDVFTVAAIEDGSFREQRALDEYGPRVFGGGTVSFSRSAAEFTASLPATCFPAELRLRAIEVNQGVQTWENAVPLVEDRPTIVRVFMETADGSTARVPVRLRGFSGTRELAGSPLTPINPGGLVNVDGDASDARHLSSSSANFFLPEEWRTGSVRLEADASGSSLECDAPVTNCDVEVSFDVRNDLALRIVPLGVGALRESFPDPGTISEQKTRLAAALPISNLTTDMEVAPDSGLGFSPLTRPRSFWAQTLNHLDRLRATCTGDCPTLWVGVMEGGPSLFEAYGMARGFVSGWYTDSGDAAGTYVGAHEVLHNLGVRHVHADAATPAVCRRPDDDPFILPDTVERNGERHVALGPVGDTLTEPWGINYHRSNASEVGGPRSFVMSPYETAALMSYCRRMPQGRWPSQAAWESVNLGASGYVDLVRDPFETFADTQLVSGITVDDVPELSPVAASSVGVTPDDPEGEISITVTYADDTTHAVTVELGHVAPDASGTEPDVDLGSFIAVVPSGEISQVEVDAPAGSQEIIASDTAPTVEILAPAAGSSIDAPVDLEVALDDADGDEVTYSAAYSPDGTAWEPLAMDADDEAVVVIDPARLAPSPTGLLRVVASDGVRTATTEVEVEVVATAATVEINQLGRDLERASGRQTVVMLADALSSEDVDFAWRSSRQGGTLSTSEELVVPADALAEGEHVITLEATTASGETSTATTQLEISRVASANIPTITGLDAVVSDADVNLDVSFSDDPAEESHVATITWGDGSVDVLDLEGVRSFVAGHSYITGGTYTIQVCVEDSSAAGCASTTVTIGPLSDPDDGPAPAPGGPTAPAPSAPAPAPSPVDDADDVAVLPAEPIDLDDVCAGVTSVTFPDVGEDSTHAPAIGCLASPELGIIAGYPDGAYRPGVQITRAQTATLLARILEALGRELPEEGEGFSDVRPGMTHAEAIGALATLGVIEGRTDGHFRPGARVNRGQWASLLVRTYELIAGEEAPAGEDAFTDDDGSTHEAAINAAVALGLLVGYDDGTFDPSGSLPRDQAATSLARLLTVADAAAQ